MDRATPEHLATAQLAELAGITFTAAASAVRKGRKGESWRGVVLDIHSIHSAHGRGGDGGRQSFIRFDSLPIDLQHHAARILAEPTLAAAAAAATLPAPKPTAAPKRRRRNDLRKKRVVLSRAIDQARAAHGSPEKAGEIAAAVNHDLPQAIATFNVRDWTA